MSGKECPKCKLILPSTAITCYCGYNFETDKKPPNKKNKSKKPVIIIGVIVFISAVLAIIYVLAILKAWAEM